MNNILDQLNKDDMLQIDPSIFPPLLRMLTKLIGIEDTIKLTSNWGGRVLTVPTAKTGTSYLYKILSHESADKLISEYGGDSFDCPKPDKIFMQIRNKKIRQQRNQGTTIAQLTSDFNLTRRHISNICKGVTPNAA